jgi:hypothetical protein
MAASVFYKELLSLSLHCNSKDALFRISNVVGNPSRKQNNVSSSSMSMDWIKDKVTLGKSSKSFISMILMIYIENTRYLMIDRNGHLPNFGLFILDENVKVKTLDISPYLQPHVHQQAWEVIECIVFDCGIFRGDMRNKTV